MQRHQSSSMKPMSSSPNSSIRKRSVTSADLEKVSGKLGWKSILLLQFEKQFTFAINMGIIFCYSIVTFEASKALAVFENETPVTSYMTDTKGIVYSFDAFYIVDILFMIFYKNTEWPEVSHRYPARNALLLGLEALTLLPVDAVYYNIGVTRKPSTIALLRLRYVFRLGRLAYNERIPTAMTKEQSMITVILRFFAIICLVSGTLASILHPYLCHLHRISVANNTDFYFLNLYVATEKITGKGFGEIDYHKVLRDEVIQYALSVVSFVSYILLGYCTSRLVCTFISRDKYIYSFLIKFTRIMEELAEWRSQNKSTWKNYDEALYSTIQTYYQMIWDKKRWYLSRVFKEEILPKVMFKDLYLDMSWGALKHSHLFKTESVNFLRELANQMSHTVFAPGEILYRRHCEKSSMIYIVTGIVQVLSGENGETPIISFSGGTCIGESSLVIDYQSSWTVVCKTYCEVTILDKRNFIKISLVYPKIFRTLTRSINRRYAEAKHMKKVFEFQWQRSQVTNPHTITMIWIKRTLHELIDSQSSQREKDLLWDESYTFCAVYLDLLVITEDIELVSDKIFLRKQFPSIFQPESIFLDGWNVFIAIVAMIVLFAYPCYMIFCNEFNSSTHAVIYLTVTFIWCADIFIQSSTAVRTKDALYSSIPSIIYYRLTNSAFLLDIFSALPFSAILNLINNQIQCETLLLAEAHKLLKVYRLSFIFAKLENLHLSNKIVLKYVKVFMIDFFIFYFMATVLYYLICAEGGCSSSYYEKLKLVTKEISKWNVLLHLYTGAALFLGNVSYVDFFKFINYDKLPAIIFLQFIYTFFAVFTLAYASILETLKESKIHQYKEYVATMDVVMSDFNVSSDLQKRVRCYLKDHYWVDKGLRVLEPNLFKDNMSPNLYTITQQVIYGKFLHGMPLFHGIDDEIIVEIARSLKISHFPQQEVITYSREVCKEMHIIQFGYCTIQGETNKILQPGDCFCLFEMCLQVPTFFTVITSTDCKILSISYKDYARLTAKFPNFKYAINMALDSSITQKGITSMEHRYRTLDDLVIRKETNVSVVRKFHVKKKDRNFEFRRLYLREYSSFKWVFKYLLIPYTFPTDGTIVFYWEVSRLIFAFATNILDSFVSICEDCPLFYVIIFLDVTAWIDIYYRQHVCYYNELGVEVSHPMRTAEYYWNHGFLIDFIASAPIDYVFQASSKPYFRANRILQLHRPFNFVRFINNNNISRSKIYDIAKYIPITLLFVNYLSTMGLYVTCDMKTNNSKPSCDADLWALVHLNFSSVDYRTKRYAASLMVTTMSLTMIGFTKIYMKSMLELLCASAMVLCGHIFFVWMTARMVANNFYRKTDLTGYQEAMRHLLSFVNYRKVDKNIKNEIIEYFEFMWKKTKGNNLVVLLGSFSTAIKEDILYDMFGKNMRISSIFPRAPKSFFKSLLLEAKYEVYIHKGIIYHVNDVHGFIFFLLKGNVEVLGPDYNKLTLLASGSVFGNLSNCLESRQTLMMVARGHVEVLKISTVFFHSVLSKYPLILHHFKKLTSINVDYLENLDSAYYMETTTYGAAKQIRTTKERQCISFYLMTTRIFEESTCVRIVKMCILIACCFCGFHLEIYQLGSNESNPFLVVTLYILDVLYLVKIYLHFHTAFKDESGLPVTNRGEIARNYMNQKLGFYFDLAAVLPIEIFSLAFVTQPYFWSVWSWLRKNRLIRIVIVLHALRSSQEKLHVNVRTMRILYMITWITISLQTMGTLLMSLRLLNYTDTSMSSTTKLSLLIRTYRIIIYTISGAALTNLRIQFNMYIVINSIILMLVCRFFITLFIAEICSMLENINQNQNKYRLFTLYLKYQIKEEDVSVPLRKRTGEYLNLLWIHHRGVQFPRLLREAPYYLKEAILNAMYGFHLRRHPLLRHCHTDLIRQMAATFEVIVFFPGNFVTYEGDIDGCMYFIHKGEVHALVEDTLYSELAADTLTTGECFGLDQGLYKNCGHDYSYKVSKKSVILALNRVKWIHLLQFFPASSRVLFNLRDYYMYKE